MNYFIKLIVICFIITTSAGNFKVGAAAALEYKTHTLEGECPSTTKEFDQLKQEISDRFGPLIELLEITEKTTAENIPKSEKDSTEREDIASEQSMVTTDKDEIPTEQKTTLATTILNTCGNGSLEWRQVAFINMTDTSYNCPPGLNLTSYSKRTCHSSEDYYSDYCSSTIFNVGGSEYSRVCGRIIGYQFGVNYAFKDYYEYYYFEEKYRKTLNDQYVDGVSLTHGPNGKRQHIWTFAVGLTEADHPYDAAQCPCDIPTEIPGLPPLFLDNDYFCESGTTRTWPDRTFDYDPGELFPDDPLWDGQGCLSNSTCCQFNNPPWFIKDLPNPTTDNIELRLCIFNAKWVQDIPLELIELYIQ